MVIDARPRPATAAIAEAADRVAAALAADQSVARDVAASGGAEGVAHQLVPIVAWAFDVPRLSDLDAVRTGVTVARTRMLLGMPRRIVLAAVHELPTVLVGDVPSSHRLDPIAIEVGLRLRSGRDLPVELRAG